MVSHKGHIGHKARALTRETPKPLSLRVANDDRLSNKGASVGKHRLRLRVLKRRYASPPLPKDTEAPLAGTRNRRVAPALKGSVVSGSSNQGTRESFREGRSPVSCRAGGQFRVRQGERHEVRGVGTAHGRSLFTAMTLGPCRRLSKTAFRRRRLPCSSGSAETAWLCALRTFALKPTGANAHGDAADAGRLARLDELSCFNKRRGARA